MSSVESINSKNENFTIHFALRTFVVLYMSGFLLEMTESWKYPIFSLIFTILISIFVFIPGLLISFSIFLLASTSYILLFRFPEVANHVNLIVFLNIGLIYGYLHLWIRGKLNRENYWHFVLPFARISLILVYFLAGFHKFNSDFFNPIVSCAGGLLLGGFLPMMSSRTLGVPSIFILVISLIFLTYKLWGNSFKKVSRQTSFALLFILVIASIVFAANLSVVQDTLPGQLKSGVILFLASVVVIWEIVGALLLFIPRFQGFIILFSLIMHMSFAPIGFVDFGALAFALLFAFVPPNHLELLDKHSELSFGKASINRIKGYFSMLIILSLLKGLHYQLGIDLGDIKFLSGMLLNTTAIIFIWPILENLCSKERLPWNGVTVWPSGTPKFIGIIALLMILFGMTSYVGLRTAGNFSMFSNLQTEGARSNHFLLASNPFKVWSYQEDIVEVIEINDKAAKLGHKYRPLKGAQLPVVEFRKLIHKWTKASYIVPITFVHNGITYSSDDIVNDPVWRTPNRNWEMYLMDFRIIQPEGPNQCRW